MDLTDLQFQGNKHSLDNLRRAITTTHDSIEDFLENAGPKDMGLYERLIELQYRHDQHSVQLENICKQLKDIEFRLELLADTVKELKSKNPQLAPDSEFWKQVDMNFLVDLIQHEAKHIADNVVRTYLAGATLTFDGRQWLNNGYQGAYTNSNQTVL